MTSERYIVKVMEDVGGRLGWRVILNTDDVEEANSQVEAMQQDGVKVTIDVIPAKPDAPGEGGSVAKTSPKS